jgi:anti-sigma factor RsiW
VSHPEDLLADYVDGTLDERARADVDTHLLGCERCREEVRLAASAKAALVELEDRPVPFGVTGPVLAEAGRRFERRRGVTWERFQWAAGLAAAAALIVVVALNVGDGGSDDTPRSAAAGSDATGAAGSTGAAELAAPVLPFRGLERQADVTYDLDGIEAVAVEAAEDLVSVQAGQGAGASATDVATEDSARTADAKSCVRRSQLQGAGDVLIRLIEAEFEATPAYIAVFAEGPGAGQPPDHVLVVVVATDDCRLLTSASQRIAPG